MPLVNKKPVLAPYEPARKPNNEGLIKTIETLENGYRINNTVIVFNIDYGENQEFKNKKEKLESMRDAVYDIEYNEKTMSPQEAIRIAEHFFKEVIIQYLAGEFEQKLKVISKKLKSPIIH